MDDAHLKIMLEKETYKIVQGALVFIWGVRIGTLYKLLGSDFIDGCNSDVVLESGAKNIVIFGEKVILWHQMLRHIREKGVRILHGNGIVEGMSNLLLDLDFCEHCVYGKKNQVSYPSGAKRAKGILELVHSDMFGPVSVPSLDKSMYYASFIDGFSRNTWIYFLRKKSKILDKFKEFNALLEN